MDNRWCRQPFRHWCVKVFAYLFGNTGAKSPWCCCTPSPTPQHHLDGVGQVDPSPMQMKANSYPPDTSRPSRPRHTPRHGRDKAHCATTPPPWARRLQCRVRGAALMTKLPLRGAESETTATSGTRIISATRAAPPPRAEWANGDVHYSERAAALAPSVAANKAAKAEGEGLRNRERNRIGSSCGQDARRCIQIGRAAR